MSLALAFLASSDSNVGPSGFSDAMRAAAVDPGPLTLCRCAGCAAVSGSDSDRVLAAPGFEGPQFWAEGGYERGGGLAANGKVSFTIDQAAAQLTRSGTSWSGFGALGTPTEVTYAYKSIQIGAMPEDTGGFSRFNATQIEATEFALKGWSDAANITFTRVTDPFGGEGIYGNNATMLFANFATGADPAAAFASFPGSRASTASAGDVWVKSAFSYNVTPVLGDYGYQVLTHEIGHAIGISHPGTYNAAPGVTNTYEQQAEYFEDSRQYSVMSYFGGNTSTGANLPGFAAGPQLDDIAAAQRLYGANMSTRTGNTVYGYNSNADRPWFNVTSGGIVPVFAVWDAGGVDALDFSGYSDAQTIDLRDGAFSSVGGSRYNIAIAKGALIENGIGGSGADLMRGNAAANNMVGALGSDTIDGGLGADTLSGGDGLDTIAFGLATSSVFVSLQDQGIAQNTLVGSKLLTGFENISGSGFDDALVGDAGANRIEGGAGFDRLLGDGGADSLVGGAGVDWLTGGVGSDSFIYLDAADAGVAGADVLWDFETAVDKIDFTAVGFLPAGIVSIAKNGSNTYVYMDTNGDFSSEGLVNVFKRTVAVGDVLKPAGTKFYLYGDDTANSLVGSSAGDVLVGRGDVDTLTGGGGGDLMYGGAGSDLFVISGVADATEGDIIGDFVSGTDRIDVSAVVAAGGRLTVAADNLGNTFLYATQAGSTASIAAVGAPINGADVVAGAAPQSLTYFGANLADTFVGGAAGDLIYGFGGADTLAGGGGSDQLYGGLGAPDTFEYAAVSDSTLTAYDAIGDFEIGVDKIDLRSTHTAGANDGVYLSTFGGSTFVYVDIGNDGTSDMLIVLTSVTGVTSGDILF